MEIRFYKPTVADIPTMQALVKEEVEQGNYENTDEDFFEFMSYKFESSIADYADQIYDEYRDERCGL